MSKEESKASQAVAEQAEEKVEKVEVAPEVPAPKEETKSKEKAPAKPEKEEAVKAEEKAPEKEEKPALSPKMEEMLITIEQMTVLELSELVKALEDRFGVTAAMPMAGMMAGPAGGAAQDQEEEKTAFDVVLDQVGDKKIQVIKELRVITSLGLKEAKELVDNAPKPVKEGATKEEADEIKKKLEAVGATVVIK